MSVKYVEYLYGDNNSYIDTGIVVQSGYQIEVTFMSTENKLSTQKNDWSGIFGVGNSIGYSYDTVPYGISAGLYGSRICVKNDGVNNYEYLNIDGTCYNQKYTLSLTAGENVTNPANLFLFAVNFTRNAGESNPYSWGYSCLRIYDFKIYNAQGTLIQHLKPCLDDNNVPCMYDEVSGEYFENLGTGTFGYEGYHLYLFADNNEGTAENLGSYRLYNMKIDGDSEWVESGVDYVDYLESTGTQYIDTGIMPTLDMTFYCDYTFNSWNHVMFGSGEILRSYGIYQSSNRVCYGGSTNISGYSLKTYGHRYQNTLTPTGYTLTCVDENITINGNYTHTLQNEYRYTVRLFGEPRKVDGAMYYGQGRIYDFKIYNAQGTLIQHLKPCLDEEGIPCMYDEVSKQYFHNQGTGIFGYKKKLRDFQPVLDSNGIPCLMDKVNKKYYYDKNGKGFGYEEGYTPVSYLRSDGYSWINTGIIPTTNTKVVVDTYMLLSDLNNGPALFGSTQTFLSFTFQTTVSWLYVGKINGKHSVGLAGHDFTGRHTITIDLSDMTNIVNIDGTNYGTFTGTQATDSKSIYLWNMFDSWGALGNSGGTAKIYSFKIYENNVLTMDLIPVLDNDGTPCMYDLVTETFFYNQGAGEFSYGIEELECPKANYVEYIRGGRNAYINTLDISGMINSEVEVEWKFKLESINNNTGWFGTVGSYNGTPLNARNTYNSTVGGHAIHVVFLEPSNEVIIKTEGRHVGVHVMKINKTGLYMDGNLEAELPGTTYYDSYSFVQPFALLGYNYWNGIQSRFPENVLYYVTVKQAGELILDFRPCLDDNGVLCVYEAVNGVYYYNSDTGEFGGHGESMGYTPIKYIETNGTQYIDTGVVVNDNTDIDMVARTVAKEYTPVEYLQGDGASWIDTNIYTNPQCKYELIQSGTGNEYGIMLSANDEVRIGNASSDGLRVYNQAMYIILYSFKNNYGDEGVYTITLDKNKLYLEEQLFHEFDTVDNITSYANPLRLFKAYSSRTDIYQIATNRFISLKVWNENNELITHIIPVLDSEGTPCMYDKVNNQFFYNQGTGTFAHGNAVDKNYLMNDFYIKSTYKYKETNTNVEPNLTASAGATLTLGSTYIAFLTETEIEQAINNGWTIE